MPEPRLSGRALIEAIDLAPAETPTLWWLGHCGFALKYHDMVFYLDPCLAASPERIGEPVLDPADVEHAELIFCSHTGPRHMCAPTLHAMLRSSKRAKIVMPKSAAEHANSLGIPYGRMTTTDAGLRVEYFKTGDYIRVYAVPSAHPNLDRHPIGGYPYLGFLIRCGGITIYHAGDTVWYPELGDYLKPYTVTLALLPISGPESNGLTPRQAVELASSMEARWLVPMHYGTFAPTDASEFTNLLLFERPSQRFKIFEPGEGWTIPAV